jgi:hypothetical protein
MSLYSQVTAAAERVSSSTTRVNPYRAIQQICTNPYSTKLYSNFEETVEIICLGFQFVVLSVFSQSHFPSQGALVSSEDI